MNWNGYAVVVLRRDGAEKRDFGMKAGGQTREREIKWKIQYVGNRTLKSGTDRYSYGFMDTVICITILFWWKWLPNEGYNYKTDFYVGGGRHGCDSFNFSSIDTTVRNSLINKSNAKTRVKNNFKYCFIKVAHKICSDIQF